MPESSTWIALVSWPPMSSTVRVFGNIACAPRPWHRISERICPSGNGSRARRRAVHLRERAQGVVLEMAGRRRQILDLEDRLVVEPREQTEGESLPARLLLGMTKGRAHRKIAKEVALSARAPGQERRGFLVHPPENGSHGGG